MLRFCLQSFICLHRSFAINKGLNREKQIFFNTSTVCLSNNALGIRIWTKLLLQKRDFKRKASVFEDISKRKWVCTVSLTAASLIPSLFGNVSVFPVLTLLILEIMKCLSCYTKYCSGWTQVSSQDRHRAAQHQATHTSPMVTPVRHASFTEKNTSTVSIRDYQSNNNCLWHLWRM